MWVVTYDNGSGYREWASTPQPTPEAAWSAAGLSPGGQLWQGSDTKLQKV